jgi:hypothetical protein
MITPLMQGVGCCECGISFDIAYGVVKDHVLGYVSPRNHPYRPMSQMGSTSQVLITTGLSMKLVRGWHQSGMSRTLTRHESNLSLDVWAGLGKGWKMWGNPYSHRRVWWLVLSFRVGIVVHLCRVWKLEVLRDGTIQLFLLSIPMVALLMNYEHLCVILILIMYFRSSDRA